MDNIYPDAFEIGPIRPPSESGSLLIRVTRNCPWNKCGFCRIYRKRRFETRPMEEIERDIDNIAAIRELLISNGLAEPAPDYDRLSAITQGLPPETLESYSHVLQWLARGGQTAFLQDANTMVLSHNKLMHILTYLKCKLPELRRVTAYGRADALNRLTAEQLAELRAAGLDRVHSGFETGSNAVLRLINKGYTKAVEIEAGQKVKSAGIELSIYFMPGVGGLELSGDNAVETADVISRVNPDFVRIRTFVSIPKTELFEAGQEGHFTECTDMEKLREIKLLLENINGADGMLYSDHIVNLLENIQGRLDTDKEKMLGLIEKVEHLPEGERKRFQLARRLGLIRDYAELPAISSYHRQIIEQAVEELKTEEEFEGFMRRFLRKYI